MFVTFVILMETVQLLKCGDETLGVYLRMERVKLAGLDHGCWGVGRGQAGAGAPRPGLTSQLY